MKRDIVSCVQETCDHAAVKARYTPRHNLHDKFYVSFDKTYMSKYSKYMNVVNKSISGSYEFKSILILMKVTKNFPLCKILLMRCTER